MKMRNRMRAVLVLLLVATLPAFAAGGRGMTWWKLGHANGVDWVGCRNGEPNGCNAYQGETSCAVRAPVLCLKQDGSPSPVPFDFYKGWAQGNIGLSRAVRGDSMRSVNDGNAICRAEFGPGWRMAEFHDGGGGWSWQAYGNIDSTTRFWVYINDQNANCWQ